MKNHTLLWVGPGIYEPLPILDQTEWWRNDDGHPFVGVQVDCVENARKFAAVKELMLPLCVFENGALQVMIDAANAELLAEEWGEYQAPCNSKPLSVRDGINRIRFDGSIEDDHDWIRSGR